MKPRLLQFIDRLRSAGLVITPAETLDAVRAVAIVGIDPLQFREAIAATVVKDEADRGIFEQEFDRFFAVPTRPTAARKQFRAASGTGRGTTTPPETPSGARPRDKPSERELEQPGKRETPEQRDQRSERRRRMAYLRSLQDVPLKDLTPPQIEECDVLLVELAKRLRTHIRRRQRAARRGRLDLRRTIRRSIGSGGVPLHPQFRRRRPGKPDLVALCDMSYSVAVASRFLLGLLEPASEHFRRVRLFGYVDVAVGIGLEDGHLVQDGPLDLYARSDFGKVLLGFWDESARLLTRDTVLLILGDARNNRRPPRTDVLARMKSMTRQVVWLNPEPRERWDTGDSVQSAYAPHCDVTLSAGTLRELYVAVKLLDR